MARIRTIKPEYFFDTDINELPELVQKVFTGLWCYADKAGRMEDNPQKLRAQILPYKDKADMDDILRQLSKKPFIIRYSEGTKRYIQIKNWAKHQRPHHTEPESVIPPPPDNPNPTDNGEKTVVEPLEDRKNPAGREGKGKERKGGVEGNDTRPSALHSDEDFLNTLKTNPAYKHIDIDTELAKMDAWLQVRKGRQKTRRFIVNWLNKIDKPVAIEARKPKAKPGCTACNGTGKLSERGGAQCFCVV